MFNPKVSDFLKEKPHLTVIGLFWAGWWRLYLVIVAGFIVVGILGALLGN
jgi:hypothetical protein